VFQAGWGELKIESAIGAFSDSLGEEGSCPECASAAGVIFELEASGCGKFEDGRVVRFGLPEGEVAVPCGNQGVLASRAIRGFAWRRVAFPKMGVDAYEVGGGDDSVQRRSLGRA
jgi:hypothetical protein